MDDRPGVLFLCVHNAGRSQMAAGYLRRMAGDRVEVFSGGSDPGDDINTVVVAAMAEEGIDIATEYPKPWTDEASATGCPPTGTASEQSACAGTKPSTTWSPKCG